MKIRTFVFKAAAAVFAGLLVLGGSVNAAPGGIKGPPNDGGGQAPPVDFGDLVILYRGDNGVPLLTPQDGDTGRCQQPLAFNLTDPADSCPDSCVVGAYQDSTVDVVYVDQTTCAVSDNCAPCTQEVDFGRINEARSSDEVFDSQLQDVVFNLATSDCAISLDPAGRMVTGTIPDPSVPNVYTTSAIDSPLQNLAIYRQLILTGSIGITLPADALVTAARGLGAASDKTGEVNVDMVAYLNQTMGLTDEATATILDPKICIEVREEVQGAVQLVRKCFLNYGTYEYHRQSNFTALPDPPYIDDSLGSAGDDVPGWFEYLALVPDTSFFQIEQGPILDAVFPDSPFVGFDGSDIGAFAQAADDTRGVINFMHNWPVPNADEYATPVPCNARTDIAYDVSIPEQSGLQVPRNIVTGTEGREFIVTVANAGPDPATGTVTVTAEVADGSPAPGPWTYPFTDLAAAQSVAFTQLFTAPTVSEATTITWRADIDAPYDPDDGPLGGNNTATATSSVRLTGGGGGDGRP